MSSRLKRPASLCHFDRTVPPLCHCDRSALSPIILTEVTRPCHLGPSVPLLCHLDRSVPPLSFRPSAASGEIWPPEKNGLYPRSDVSTGPHSAQGTRCGDAIQPSDQIPVAHKYCVTEKLIVFSISRKDYELNTIEKAAQRLDVTEYTRRYCRHPTDSPTVLLTFILCVSAPSGS